MTWGAAFWGLFALLAAAGLTSACVRLDEPDAFACGANEDCLSTERCGSAGLCVSKSTCDAISDCDNTETCTNGKCVPAECFEGHDDVCGGYTCGYPRRCNDHCAVSSDCKLGYGCKASACTPSGPTPNGVSCDEDEDCASLVCCGPAGARKCSDGCLPATSVCVLDSDCSDGHCCATPLGRVCGSSPCQPLPLNAPCVMSEECSSAFCSSGLCQTRPCKTNQDCATGFCDSGTCATPPCKSDGECSTGYCDDGDCETSLIAKGGVCKTDRWCQGGVCTNGSCRGTAAEGAACTVDNDCAGGQCCPDSGSFPFYQCGPQGRGCHQGLGASCDLDQCWAGDCYGDLLCTKTCTFDTDCGLTPTGGQMVCRLNGTGERICFPTCSDESDCSETAPFFTCPSGVCSGDTPATQPR